jgi:raffinose/stachyose/melibiose transport system substrate-binding protein
MRFTHRRKVSIALAIGTAAALALTSCSGATPDSGGDIDVSTEITTDPVTLTLAYTDDPPTQALVDGFTELHPNVTIEVQQTPFSDYVKSIKLAMASDNPPDIAQYNPGAMRALVPAGLILDLTPWSDAYGWDDSFPQASLAVLTSDKDAKQFGTGGLYAAPGALSVLGVYYNKALVEAAGVTDVPADLGDFEDDLAAVKDSGVAPLSVAALEVGGFHIWNALLDRMGDVQDYRDWVYGAAGSSIETDAAKEATDTLVDWIDKGYVPESSNAVGYADGLAAFTSGQAAYHVNGNWAASAIETELGDDVGFFLMPAPEADGPLVASGASVAYSISSKSKNPNVAAAFLDYLGSAEAATVQFDGGFMPVNKDATVDATGLKAEIADAFSQLVAVDGIVPFPDFAAPSMIDQLTSGIQGLISKQSTTDQYLEALQTTWSEYHG